MHKPVVYFAQHIHSRNIKIGLTTNLPARNGGLGANVVIIATQDGGRDLERTLHARFAEDCIGSEWFHLSPQLLVYIEAQRPYVMMPRRRAPNWGAVIAGTAPEPTLTLEDMRAKLQASCTASGGQNKWAAQHGIPKSSVSEVLTHEREPGPSVLQALGYKKCVLYQPDAFDDVSDAFDPKTSKAKAKHK